LRNCDLAYPLPLRHSSSPDVLLFFVTCSRSPRDTPSFPTRRSSDLEDAHEPAEAVRAYDQVLKLRAKDPEAVAGRKRLGVLRSKDRKSTRLNSSHVAISYAVFCLKKKNKNMNSTMAFTLANNLTSLP